MPTDVRKQSCVIVRRRGAALHELPERNKSSSTVCARANAASSSKRAAMLRTGAAIVSSVKGVCAVQLDF